VQQIVLAAELRITEYSMETHVNVNRVFITTPNHSRFVVPVHTGVWLVQTTVHVHHVYQTIH
jgi:hypothetical protein